MLFRSAIVTFVEIETDDGLKGHAFSSYPMRFGIADFINREVRETVAGMDPLRPEAVRSALYWKLSNKLYMGINGAWGAGNPNTGIGNAFEGIESGIWYPFASVNNDNRDHSLELISGTAWPYAVPTGYQVA